MIQDLQKFLQRQYESVFLDGFESVSWVKGNDFDAFSFGQFKEEMPSSTKALLTVLQVDPHAFFVAVSTP